MSWGDLVTLIGAGVTLVGAVRSLAPLGGWRAVFPPGFHRSLAAVRQAVRRQRERLRRRRIPPITGEMKGTLPAVVSTGSMVHMAPFPDITTDPTAFAAAVDDRTRQLNRRLSATQQDTDRERTDREAAVQAARDDAAAGIATAVENTKRVELSGARMQLVGVAFVVAGVIVDSVTGG